MNAAAAFEVVADAMSVIQGLVDLMDDTGDYANNTTRIWEVAEAVQDAVNGNKSWEQVEKVVFNANREL